MISTRFGARRAARSAAEKVPVAVQACELLLQHAHKYNNLHFWEIYRGALVLHPVTRAAARTLRAPGDRWAAIVPAHLEPLAVDDLGRLLFRQRNQLQRAAPLATEDFYARSAAGSLRGLFMPGRRVALCCLGERLAAAGTVATPGGRPYIALFELLPEGGATQLARTSALVDLAMAQGPGLEAEELQVTDACLVDQERALVAAANRWGPVLLRVEGGDELALVVNGISLHDNLHPVPSEPPLVWDGLTPVTGYTIADACDQQISIRPLRGGTDAFTLEVDDRVFGLEAYEQQGDAALYDSFVWRELGVETSELSQWFDNQFLADPFRLLAFEAGMLALDEDWPEEEAASVMAVNGNATMLDNTGDQGAGFYELTCDGNTIFLVTHGGVPADRRGALAAEEDITWLRTVQVPTEQEPRFVALCGTDEGGLRLATHDAHGNVVLRAQRRLGDGLPAGALQPPARWSPSGRYVVCKQLAEQYRKDDRWVLCDLSRFDGF